MSRAEINIQIKEDNYVHNDLIFYYTLSVENLAITVNFNDEQRFQGRP